MLRFTHACMHAAGACAPATPTCRAHSCLALAAPFPNGQERETARLRLLAHAAVLHMVHLASGVRFGAAATEKLDLMRRGAMNLYIDYPEGVGG